MKMVKNKGQVEISFNWIFVLIAGGLILFFFITFIVNQREASMEELGRRVQDRFDSIFTIIQQTPDSVQSFDHIATELEFMCEEGVQSYMVRGSSAVTFIDSQIIFSPRYIGDSRLVAWTRNFRGPYPVTPVLYLSDDRNMFYFIDDGENGFVRDLFNRFPDAFQKELIREDNPGLEDKGYDFYTIIFSDDSRSEFDVTLLPDDSYTRIRINVTGRHGDVPYGEVRDGVDEDVVVEFVGYEMALGAAVIGDANLFECSKDRLLQRYAASNEVQIKRVHELWGGYQAINPDHRCGIIYNETGLAMSGLENIKSHLDGSVNYEDLASIMSELQDLNDQSRRIGCAWFY